MGDVRDLARVSSSLPRSPAIRALDSRYSASSWGRPFAVACPCEEVYVAHVAAPCAAALLHTAPACQPPVLAAAVSSAPLARAPSAGRKRRRSAPPAVQCPVVRPRVATDAPLLALSPAPACAPALASSIGSSGCPPTNTTARSSVGGLVTLSMRVASSEVSRASMPSACAGGPVLLSAHRQQWRDVDRLRVAVAEHAGAAHVLGNKGFDAEASRRASAARAAEEELRRVTAGGSEELLPLKRAKAPPPPVAQSKDDGLFKAVPEVEGLLDGLTPDVLSHIGSKNPQLQFDEVEKIQSARVLFGTMSRSQVLRVVGVSSVAEAANVSSTLLESSFVLTAIEAWSAARMNAFVSTWRSVQQFAVDMGQRLVGSRHYSGLFVQQYLRCRDARARAAFRRRYAGRVVPPGLAQGSTARGGAGSILRTMSTKLFFPIDVSSLAAKEASKKGKRRAQHHEPYTARALLKLCRLARLGPSHAVRLRAAGFYAMGVNALRHKSATRFRIGSRPHREQRCVHASGGVVRGLVLTDPKTSVDSGIPSCCSANDLEGSQAWLDVLCDAQQQSSIKCIVYDDDSPNGDPFRSVAGVYDAKASLTRSSVALDALLMSPVCEPSFSRADLIGEDGRKRTPHCLKGVKPTVSRCGGDAKPETNEIGKWDGSTAQESGDHRAEGSTSLTHAGEERFAILETYTSVGAMEERVPEIMERQMSRMRSHLRAVGAEGLPVRGGFAVYGNISVA